MINTIGVIGGGAWGTALSAVIARAGYSVVLWAREVEVRNSITNTHENVQFLPGISLSEKINTTNDPRMFNNADEFGMKLQEFITTHAWGAIWGREGIPLKTRSMINIAMLAALGRTHEFRLHLSGAINNGVTKDEIAEILIQVGGYAGFPCAVDGFRQAREVFEEKNI